jgi:hypothetical protein
MLLTSLVDTMVYQKEVVLMIVGNCSTIVGFITLVLQWFLTIEISTPLIRRVS